MSANETGKLWMPGDHREQKRTQQLLAAPENLQYFRQKLAQFTLIRRKYLAHNFSRERQRRKCNIWAVRKDRAAAGWAKR